MTGKLALNLATGKDQGRDQDQEKH